MNINSDNYEEYFLLYADKELSAAERKQVEVFVTLNPAFEEEFFMLQQAVLKPDHAVSMDDKNFLYKSQDGFINASNQAEIFLLYHDNELGIEERKKTEEYIKKHTLQNEFALFQQIKLEPDLTIIFDRKKSLYKNTASIKVPLAWMLAAATFIGFGIWSGVNYFNNIQSKGEMALQIDFPKVREASKKITNELYAIQDHQQQPKSVLHDLKNNSSTSPKFRALDKNKQADQSEHNVQNVAINSIVRKNEPELKPTNDLPKPLNNSSITSQRNIASITIPVNTSISTRVTNIAQPASYILDADQKNENYVFYNVTEEQFKRSKLGGFLRKVKRVIERKNPLSNFKNSPEVVAK